jgi:hypothetical protein
LSLVRLGYCLLAGMVACGGSAFSVTGGGPDGSIPVDATADVTEASVDSSALDASEASSRDAADDAGDAEGGPAEAGTVEGGAGSGDAGVACGLSLTCADSTDICCLSSPPMCESSSCVACVTQLACASDRDCSGLTGTCCIGNTKDAACSPGHYVSRCAAACGLGQSHLCDPTSQTANPCLVGSCSTDTSDLAAVGLQGPPYGVCK